jgi:hypothetical protein
MDRFEMSGRLRPRRVVPEARQLGGLSGFGIRRRLAKSRGSANFPLRPARRCARRFALAWRGQRRRCRCGLRLRWDSLGAARARLDFVRRRGLRRCRVAGLGCRGVRFLSGRARRHPDQRSKGVDCLLLRRRRPGRVSGSLCCSTGRRRRRFSVSRLAESASSAGSRAWRGSGATCASVGGWPSGACAGSVGAGVCAVYTRGSSICGADTAAE